MDTTEEIMCERLLERGKTSGREDDNEESIKKRFSKLSAAVSSRMILIHFLCVEVYKEQTRPVIDYYLEKGKVAAVSQLWSIAFRSTDRTLFADSGIWNH